MHINYCEPVPRADGRTYDGWHLKRLRAYCTEEEAQAVADSYGMGVFYCEYGKCWHIKKGRYKLLKCEIPQRHLTIDIRKDE